ncbi:leucine-rich repeat transmembrane protein kinase family protein [Actinidia rufa]|uniref:Leucine-rich repeat transmembrane protein kinase family protein n=1 Tax=Actinidia rufa TaxID=165716 RepID=A0A7J0EHJ0_9ERIC|nr:leucine-rich repeat transmembrane protein kinase family protein [Actinidia rufa]
MKRSLTGIPLTDWDVTGATPCSNFTGISCNEQGHVVGIDISGWSLSGLFPENVCSYLPELRILRLGHNNFHGKFPHSITNCSLLEELNMSSTYLTGTLPDFTPMTGVKLLDLSYNLFTNDFPISVTNLTNLEVLNFNENEGFNLWKLPENFSRLTKLKSMVLTTCMVSGFIPASIGNMTSLIDLELSGNLLVGQIPVQLGLLKNLQQLELYYNQLDGEIPKELGNLSELIDLDMSVNKLTGKIPESICRLPKLEVLQLYNNSLAGEIPDAIANSTTLTILSLYDNMLTGEVPRGLGDYHPWSFWSCQKINSLENYQGRLALEVNCSTFLSCKICFLGKCLKVMQHSTRISGVLPPEISQAANLVKIDLSNNLLSGPIPSDIGNLRKLNLLMLQGNKFNSSIPHSLSSLKSLNVLDLSNNLLTGNIPESLCELLPNSMNFSENQLSGPIPLSFIKGGLVESFWGNPGLCVQAYLNSSDTSFPICSQSYNRKKVNCIWVIGISVGIITIGIVLFLKRWFSKEHFMTEKDETMSSSFFSIRWTVYKIELSNGEVIAVKKLWSRRTKDSASEDQFCLDKELKTEVDTLGSIRHKNIVKLYCYFSQFGLQFIGLRVHAKRKPLGCTSQRKNPFGLANPTSDCARDCSGICIFVQGNDQVRRLQFWSGIDGTDNGEETGGGRFWREQEHHILGFHQSGDQGRCYEVLDNRLSGLYKEEMIKVLKIAIRCTYKTPGNRPTMNEVVQLLIEADPCRFDTCKSSNKAKETAAVTMAKNPYDP